ncbi:MAG: hypothetical protein VB064_11060 [Oscillospiraceae bacterium]|nr:hypothetical protein [Oscillospiraceae bacterium]
MVCEYCGKKNPENIDVCSGCGAPLPQSVQQPDQQQKQNIKVGCFGLIVILIIIILTVMLIVNHQKKDSPSKALEAQEAQIKADYIAECQTYKCTQIIADPDTYKGLSAHFNGEVSQVLKDDEYHYYVIDVEPDSTGTYSVSIYVRYSFPDGSAEIQEDNVVDVYGDLAGLSTCEYVAGGEIILPAMSAKYIDLAQ